jgi:uncharacterized protein YfaS (alpha-2-macroglobulin family)
MITSLVTSTENYDTPLLYTYGSELRDNAIILETMVLLNEKEQAIPLLRYISGELTSDRWHSTQSLAWAMKAIARYTGENKGQSEIRFDYQWDSESVQHAVTGFPVASIARETGNRQRSRLRIENKGRERLYLAIAATGIPLVGEEQASGNNLVMKVEYRLPDGSAAGVASLEQGTDLLAVVTLRNPGTLGHYKDMALTQVFPSGWEIQNSRMLEPGDTGFDIPDYQDIRDDKVLSYFDLNANKTIRIATRLTATYAGKFYLPAVSCRAMYRNDISALVPGQWVEVRDSH